MHQIDQFTTAEGQKLFRQSWSAENQNKATLVIVHGYAEHSSRYDQAAAFFNDNGITVKTFDLRGHGQSDGPAAYVNNFDEFLDDLDEFWKVEGLAKLDQPVFLLGHSMGGLIVANYCLKRKPKLSGVLLSAPALKISDDVSPVLQKISGVIASIAPKLPTIKLDSKAVSRDPEVVSKYESDALNYRGGTKARMGSEILKATKFVQSNMHKFDLPFIVMHGTADKLTDPLGSQQIHQRASSKDKTLKLWKGLYHEIMNEPEKEQVLQLMLDWIEKRL